MTQEELKLVLEALKWCHGGEPCGTAEAIAVVEKALAQQVAMVLPPIVKPTTKSEPVYIMGSYVGTGEVASVTLGGVSFTGNGTAGREADINPTGFFFQMPKSVGEVYGWHGTGKGKPMCRFDTTEAETPVGTKLYTSPPQRTWVGLTRDEVLDIEETTKHPLEFYRAIEAKLKQKNT